MQAIGNFIIIKKEKESKKIAGLDIQDDEEVRYELASVISVGDLIKGLKEGDKIKYDKNRAQKNGITVDDTLYHVITVNDVVVVL